MLPALVLSAVPRWVDPVEIPLGESVAVLEGGLAFEVEDQGAAVGFVYVGEGRFDFPIADAGEALAVAAALEAPTVASERSEDLDVLLVLGGEEPLRDLVSDAPVVVQEQRALRWTDARGGEHLVVTGLRVGDAHRTAATALDRRARRLAHTGLDPVAMLAQDALRDGEARAIVEARTGRSWLPLLEPAYRTLSDDWLTWLHDPTGAVDDRYEDAVAVLGVGEDEAPRFRVLTGSVHDGPVERARITAGAANVVVHPGGSDLEVRIEALLDVSAATDTPLLDLALPRPDERFAQGFLPTAPELRIEAVELADGQPLERVGAPWGPHPPDPGWEAGTWRLPEAVGPDETVRVRAVWSARWPASHRLMVQEFALDALDCSSGLNGPACQQVPTLPEIDELGRVTAAQPVMPRVPGLPGVYDAEIRVATTLGQRWEVAIGSGATEERDAGDGRVWVARVHSDARVSVGDLSVAVASPFGGFPGIRILKHSPFAGGSPEFLRAVLNFYSTALPDWPHDEVVVVQAPDAPVVYTGFSPDGLPAPAVEGYPGHLLIRGLRSYPLSAFGSSPAASILPAVERTWPHAIERGLAEALAAGWWSRLPFARRDAWLAEALPEVYRDLFVEEAWGEEVAETWRRGDPDDRARLLGLGLRHRIGEKALLEGLSRFYEGGDPSLDALEAALEGSAHARLDDFFDAWIVAGLRPKVTASWRPGDEGVHVSLVSDVRVGTYEIPVVVTSRKGPRTSWVPVRDGVGQAVIPVRGAGVRVEVDPHHWLPLAGRASHRAGQSDAEERERRRSEDANQVIASSSALPI